MAIEEFFSQFGVAIFGILGVIIGSIASYIFQHSFDQNREKKLIKIDISKLVLEVMGKSNDIVYSRYNKEGVEKFNQISALRGSFYREITAMIYIYFKNLDDITNFNTIFSEFKIKSDKYRRDTDLDIEEYEEMGKYHTKTGLQLIKIVREASLSL